MENETDKANTQEVKRKLVMPDVSGATNFPNGPCILDEEMWCEEGCRRLRITQVYNDKNQIIGVKFETLDVSKGWMDVKIVDTITIANFRLRKIRGLIDRTLERYEDQQ